MFTIRCSNSINRKTFSFQIEIVTHRIESNFNHPDCCVFEIGIKHYDSVYFVKDKPRNIGKNDHWDYKGYYWNYKDV